MDNFIKETPTKNFNIKIFDEFILSNLSNTEYLVGGNFIFLPKELISHIYYLSVFNPKILWLSNKFRLWYDVIFSKIRKILSEYIFYNTDDEHPCIFWEKNVYIVYFIYLQLLDNNHINFSFIENNDGQNQKDVILQRKYVHIINNIMLENFPNYRVRKTKKINKNTWNPASDSEESDVESTCIVCHIYLFLKDRNRKRNNKKIYSISFRKEEIKINKK